MITVFKKILVLILFTQYFCQISAAEIVKAFVFTEAEFKNLKVKKVKGQTSWLLGSNENGTYIRAEAKGKGSGLGKEVLINLLKTPFINITWKVEKDLSGITEN